ncbi:MAG: pyruvate/2-oxoglutarate dehydrogenase complex, dehydrogenase component beta subunit [Pedosphaera sp.]|nr:pyruvate/2-oxoglutarate dehydrogenase complex, dehydrogenase component beta subunit [Pedosphaera sp.]
MPWSRIEQSHSAADSGRIISYKDAIREAIDQAMIHDPRVFVIGLDADDKFGAFGTLLDMTHPERIIGTPISENAMTGVALGAAVSGMRPLYVHLRVDFMLLTMDQIVNYVAKWRYMTQGQVKVPIVIRAVIGRGWGCGAQHSQTLSSFFTHIPGLKVVMPSTPYDAKGLLLAAIKDDYPVISIEHRWLYKNTGGVPQELYTVPLGKGRILKSGNSLTVVATSAAVIDTLNGCEKHNLDVEVIDPRTLKPLDEGMILESVAKTGRLLVVDYDYPSCGFAAEVCAMVAEKGFASLKAPVQRYTFPESSMPASGILERAYYPNPDKIAARIKEMLAEQPVLSRA